LAHSEAAVPLDAKYLTGHNTCYTVGASERNAQREAALSGDYPERLASAFNQLLEAERTIATLFAYGQPLSADQYSLRKAFVKGE